MIEDYGKFIAKMRELSAFLVRRSRGDHLRSTLRMLHGRKYRAARKLIKRQLGWHRRWEAEAHIALNPWQEEALSFLWREWSIKGEPSR
jgi:hypothetical protein